VPLLFEPLESRLQPCLVNYFMDRVSHFHPGMAPGGDLPTSASCTAGITDAHSLPSLLVEMGFC
jgi:hypothetical protein